MAINTCNFVGNITAKPKLMETENTSILKFSIAVNEHVKKGEEFADRASFLDMIVFGKRATALEKILDKGMKVAITARAKQERWKNEVDENRSRIVFIVNQLELLQKRDNSANIEPPASIYDVEEDLPF